MKGQGIAKLITLNLEWNVSRCRDISPETVGGARGNLKHDKTIFTLG